MAEASEQNLSKTNTSAFSRTLRLEAENRRQGLPPYQGLTTDFAGKFMFTHTNENPRNLQKDIMSPRFSMADGEVVPAH